MMGTLTVMVQRLFELLVMGDAAVAGD